MTQLSLYISSCTEIERFELILVVLGLCSKQAWSRIDEELQVCCKSLLQSICAKNCGQHLKIHAPAPLSHQQTLLPTIFFPILTAGIL